MNIKIKRRLRRYFVRFLGFWAAILVRLTRPRVVAVTGSVGKTTTTAVIAAVLAQPEAVRLLGPVRTNSGNLNDNLGLPLALLGFQKYPRSRNQRLRVALKAPFRALFGPLSGLHAKVLVLECAAGFGTTMRRHTRIAPPTVALVTAVGPAHLERYGTVERIAEEKGLLVSAVRASGLVVLGADNSWAADMERLATARVVRVPGRGIELSQNMARVVAEFFGVPREVVERGLANAVLPHARMQTLEYGSMTVIDDTFNANPLSMRLALDMLHERAQSGRRTVAILGNMAELGDTGPGYHMEIAKYAKARADVVIAVGELARLYDADHWFANSRDCAAVIHELLQPTDLVLVKGSHGVHMKVIVRRLAKRFAAGMGTGTGPDVSSGRDRPPVVQGAPVRAVKKTLTGQPRVIRLSNMRWWQRFSRDRLTRLHYALGIPSDYAARGLPRFPEATVLQPLDGTKHLATPETCVQWVRMRDAAAAAGITLIARWAFRDIASQAELFRWYLRKGRSMERVLAHVAAPGYSEHHTGRALDIICPESRKPLNVPFERTAAYEWLRAHAHEFGFVESYEKDNPFGIIPEPWHWCLREDRPSSSNATGDARRDDRTTVES